MINTDTTQETINSYNRVASNYTGEFFDDKGDNQYTDRFLSLLPTTGKVLDAGCGPGNYSHYIANKGFDVTGVDLSLGMLEIATKKVPQATFLQQDLRQLPFKPGSFNGICAAYSLIHLPTEDILPTLKKFREVLTEKGALFLALQEGTEKNVRDNSFGDDNILTHNCYTQEEIKELLQDAGFELIFLISRLPRENEIRHNKLFVVAQKV